MGSLVPKTYNSTTEQRGPSPLRSIMEINDTFDIAVLLTYLSVGTGLLIFFYGTKTPPKRIKPLARVDFDWKIEGF